jgi:hypothetical protein
MLRTRRSGPEIRVRWRSEDQGRNQKWNRENVCAPVGGEDGNVAEGEQAAESHHNREGIHSLPIEDYIVYSPTFSVAAEPELAPEHPENAQKKKYRGNINTLCAMWRIVLAIYRLSDVENSNCREQVDFGHILKSKDRIKLYSMLSSEGASPYLCRT